MDRIRISAAVATYNGERYIREQMDSIWKNLSKEDEIIISDDGSSDHTLEILKEYEGKEIPVKVIKGPGLGIKQNINAALKECRGEYIFLADQDDVWTDDKVEKVMQYLEQGRLQTGYSRCESDGCCAYACADGIFFCISWFKGRIFEQFAEKPLYGMLYGI